ncbi:ryncolin-2-like [Anopheles moucheti]|uniref:ryncolin-2-like n=1 Tax=Anopheles moucheti TaxID=186751 RepID=UPI0022F03955|nr:ryncolin-2-like [Anopheles moucheti]
MFKINLVWALALCCTIVGMQCADTSCVIQGGIAFDMIMAKLQLLEDRCIRKEDKLVASDDLYRSCSEVSSSGVYTIQPEKPFKEPLTVLCDQQYETGGWIVIQHRFDGSTYFNRIWNEYKNGFGNLNGEFWLGLDRIYQLTSSVPHELVVLLEDFDGGKVYAKYDLFEIGDESEKYVLKKLGVYSGTAGDSFSGAKGMKFSTIDADNDTWENQCAVKYTGAWWYSNCHMSNLNGKYLRGKTTEYATSMVWNTFRGYYYSLKTSKMMLRPKKV